MPIAAAIISTDLDPDLLPQIHGALQSAGYSEVMVVSDVAGLLEWAGSGCAGEHSATPKRVRFVLLDDWIGRRAGLELLRDLVPVLRSRPEFQRTACVLLIPPDAPDEVVFAAHALNVDACLPKPRNRRNSAAFARELAKFAERLLRSWELGENGAQEAT